MQRHRGNLSNGWRLSMQVGDIVRHFLTEQIGVILSIRDDCDMVRILWTTQGLSLFGPGNKEWCGEKSLDHLTTA